MDLTTFLRQGNAEAFQQAFIRWHEQVYSYLLMKSKNSSFAEELTQITFIKLWEYRHSLSDDYALETQLFRIARTTFVDHLRSQARRRRLMDSIHKIDLPRYSYIESPEQQQQIHHALQKLPPIRRKAFILSRFDGLSYKEIASHMSISDRTVEKHISMALKQLRKMLLLLALLLLYLHR